MKNTRFSKFQAWLLRACYENMVERGRNNPTDATVYKYDIYKDYYKIECHTGKGGFHVKAFFDEPQPVKVAALSRSLRNMFEKGLVVDPKWYFAVVLTDAGVAKAKELLQFTNPE